jgi:multidrug efflux system membrane fusion protein
MKKINTVFSVFLFCLLLVNVCGAEEEAAGLDGITKPVADIELSFVQPGKVKAVHVVKGDSVQMGDVLVTLEDDIENIQKKILIARSENRVPLQLAEVELSQRLKNLENLQKARAKGATSNWEVDQAMLAVDTARLTLKVREFDRKQDQLKLESLMELLQRLTLTSPSAGIIEDVLVQPGETVQAMVPVARLVKIDPLVVDLPVPVDRAVQLKPGQLGSITFFDGTMLDGEITTISSVADAAATTLTVTLKVANKKRRPAGERVSVIFE